MIARAGSQVTYTNPINGASGEQWMASGASPLVASASVTTSATLNPSYYHQFQVTVSTDANGKQYVNTAVNETSPLTVTKSETITGTYKTQYYLWIDTNFGTTSPGSGWFDASARVQR
jgi:hypothetical protein